MVWGSPVWGRALLLREISLLEQVAAILQPGVRPE